jgi:hypothetical protein
MSGVFLIAGFLALVSWLRPINVVLARDIGWMDQRLGCTNALCK